MTQTVRREVSLPQSPDTVWQAITDSATLAEWMFPNDFQPVVGHQFTFRVPGNPKLKFDGLTVRCEVLELSPPTKLAFSWSAGGPVENTVVTFQLSPDAGGTMLVLEHSGFDITQPFGQQAFKGADYGWANMLSKLTGRLATSSRESP
jgi:uncharacterized protein YndB with AHSA1/START domain